MMLLLLITTASCVSIGATRPDVIINHLTSGNWNTYALYFYNSQAAHTDSELRDTVRQVLEDEAMDDVFYGEVDCKYDACRDIFSLEGNEEYSLDDYEFDNEDLPFLMISTYGSGFILKGNTQGDTVRKTIVKLKQLADGHNVDNFVDKIDLDDNPIHISKLLL